MEIAQALAEFDGLRTAPLKAAVEAFDAAAAGALTKACFGEHSIGATWMVKALLEQDRAYTLDLSRFFQALNKDAPWETNLHLLQSVQYAPDAALAEALTIRTFLTHKRTLLRVWAMDAFTRVALVEQGFLPKAREIVMQALNAGPASMQARAKALKALIS